jgi:hypothetical protein
MTDLIALLMEEKHENKPSKRKRVKYDESLHLLNSASKWDSVYLQRFGVEFDRAEYTPLNTIKSISLGNFDIENLPKLHRFDELRNA